MRAKNIKYYIRGVRNTHDLVYEQNLLQTYKMVYPEIECIIILSKPELNHVSSTTAKEMMFFDNYSMLHPEVIPYYANP